MANKSDVKKSVKSFIMTEFLPDEDPSHLEYSTPLISTGVLDSIANLKLVQFLEEEFSIAIQAHEVDTEYMDTIELITELVCSKL